MVVVAYSWWAVSLPPFSASATAAVLVAGVAAVAAGAWGAAGRHSVPPAPVGASAWPWAVLAVAGGAWELAAYVQHPRADHPTLSSLANTLLDSHPARAAAFVLWLAGAVRISRR